MRWPGGLRTQLALGLVVLLACAWFMLSGTLDRLDTRDLAPGLADVETVDELGSPSSAQTDASRSLLFSYFLLAALMFLLFGYAFLTWIVVRPLRAIRVATKRASDGDLASPISLMPGNEFGELARDFNQMLTTIRQQKERLEEQVNELERANKELALARDELIRSEKLATVGQLAAGLAHEIGNPLASLSGYNEILRDESDPAVTRDLLDRSEKLIERIRDVIRKLLDYSRTDEANKAKLSLDEVVREAAEVVQVMKRAKGVSIEVGEVQEIVVEGIASHLVQACVNLLINAVDASQETETPKVVIDAMKVAGQPVIRVRDHGPGIDPDLARRIFDPFYTTKSSGVGTGLGLSIVEQIVSAHGATISVVPSEEGATFEIVFPAPVAPAD